MKRTKMFNLIPLAATLAMLGAAGSAHAGAYAVSYDQITNLFITGDPATISFILPSSVNSSDKACLPNTTCVTTGGAGVTDATPAQIGIALANNTYTPAGPISPSYARADSSIDSQQTLGDSFTSARGIAEGHLAESNTANANAGNSSGTVFTSTFVVGGTGGTLQFDFDADPYMQVFLQSGTIPPSEADATMSVSFSISSAATGLQVFSWSPDGNLGSITGGTELADAFNLNTTLVALPGANGPFTYDPSNCPVGAGPVGTCFSAISNSLAAGTYTLQISMANSINLQKTVPEPTSVALVALGLTGLAFGRRGKKKA